MRKIFTAIAALAALSSSVGAANAARAYIGTYTPEPTARGNNHGEGIYLVDTDAATGAPGPIRALVAAKPRSPSWITLSPLGRAISLRQQLKSWITGRVRLVRSPLMRSTVASGGSEAA